LTPFFRPAFAEEREGKDGFPAHFRPGTIKLFINLQIKTLENLISMG